MPISSAGKSSSFDAYRDLDAAPDAVADVVRCGISFSTITGAASAG